MIVRAAVAAIATLIAAGAALWIWQVYGGPRSTMTVRVDPGGEVGHRAVGAL